VSNSYQKRELERRMASPDDLEALRYVAHTTRAVVVMLLLLRLAAAFWDCESSGSATSSSDVAVEWRRWSHGVVE
jgi:hypothetical protein